MRNPHPQGVLHIASVVGTLGPDPGEKEGIVDIDALIKA
jgi:hypothetical protein